MSEISPRPWRKKTLNDGSHCIVSGPGGLGFVCQYTSSTADAEEREMAEADGSLIVQAPELLERLKSRVEQCGCCGDADFAVNLACLDCQADVVVIARAEGR